MQRIPPSQYHIFSLKTSTQSGKLNLRYKADLPLPWLSYFFDSLPHNLEYTFLVLSPNPTFFRRSYPKLILRIKGEINTGPILIFQLNNPSFLAFAQYDIVLVIYAPEFSN
jgi:hypothetical protein